MTACQAACPTHAIVFGDLDTTSYTVSWTRGNGDYVLVVARQGAAPADPKVIDHAQATGTPAAKAENKA